MNKPKILCPTCKKQIEWSSAYPERPFCSKRCQQIDLGAWASEAFVIEGSASASPENTSIFEQTDDPSRHI